LDRDRLAETCSGLTEAVCVKFGADRAESLVAAALPFSEGPPGPPEWTLGMDGPLATIARFARADWYAELTSRLRLAATYAREELSRLGVNPGLARDWRYLANSGLPERELAIEAGLGRLGRHGLVMVGGHGSAVVLGLLLLPMPIAGAGSAAGAAAIRASLHESCANCGACIAACPTGALNASEAPGGASFSRELCLQHWSSVPGPLPSEVEAAWGGRLYGCDACQEACPLFKPDPAAICERGLLGPGLPAAWVASAPPDRLRERLRASALGMKWISPEALARNARLVLARTSHQARTYKL